MKRLYCYFLLICSLAIHIRAFGQGDAAFTASPTEGCAPLSVQFTSSVGTNTSYTHSWKFANGNTSTFPNPTATYTTPGTYVVTHDVTGPNGPAPQVTKTIIVHASPVANFTATQTTVCPGVPTTFSYTGSLGVSGPANYTWVFGNNATPNTASGTNLTTSNVSYSAPGTYNVTVQVTNAKGCFSSISKPAFITVKDKPVVNFTASPGTDFCGEPHTVTFNPAVTGSAPGPYSYSWDLDGATSTATSPSHTYTGPAPKAYTVKLTVVSNNGCSETMTKNNYIKLHKPQASFTGPSSACVYTTVNFNNTSPPSGSNYTWLFGDGGSLTSQHASHVYHTPGTYQVKLIASAGGCTDTATRTITIHPQPNPTVNMTPTQPCPAPQTICFSTTPAMSSYKWTFDDVGGPTTSTSATPCHTYNFNGYYGVILEATDANGCADTILMPNRVIIYPLNIHTSVNNARADSGCVNFTAKFKVELYRDSGYTYPYGIKSVKWKFGTGDSSSAISPTYIYTDSGHFKVTVEVETNNGCIIRDTLRVATGYKPIVDSFDAVPTSVCPKSIVFFTGHVRGFKPLKYHWDFGEGGGSRLNDSTISNPYSCLDSFTVILTASHNGCFSDTFKRDKIIEVLPPCADFRPIVGDCTAPLTITFQNHSKLANRVLWKFGDGNTSTQMNPTHTYAAQGKYTIWLIAYNDSVGCVDSMHKSVYFGPNEPDIIADKKELCIGDSVKFWSFLNGDTSTALFDWWIDGVLYMQDRDTYIHTFNTPGVYTVMVVSENLDNGCPDTVTKIDWITVGGPTPGFVAEKTHVCNPDTIRFTDTSFAGEGTSIAMRRWWFGTSAGDTLRTPNATKISRYYSATGDFDVSLTITDNLGCSATYYGPQYVHILKPDAAFSVASPVCVGANVPFTDGSVNAVKYRWLFGDGDVDTLNPAPKHVYNSMGVFNAMLIVTDTLGCKDSATVPITTTKPVADFTMSDSMAVCAPLIVYFDGTVSQRARFFTWFFDDGSAPGTRNSHSVVFNNIKDYRVKLIVKDSLGCTDSAVRSVKVLGYAGAFDYDVTEGCAPVTVTFTSNIKGHIPTIIWDFGDGNSLLGNSQTPVVTYTYTKPGKFLPRLIFNNEKGCKVGSDGLDTILVDAAIPDFETGPACEYSIVEFINKSYGVIKPLTITHWEFHDGGFSALVNPKRKYGAPGKYPVKLYVKNQNGCEDSLEKEITIHTPIEVNAGGDTIICLSDSAQLHPSGGVSYLWSPGATLSCTNCANPYAFPKVKTTYTVISTDVNGCNDTATADVDIKTHVTSVVGDGGEICQGEKFTLTVSGAKTYAWSPASTLDDHTSPTPKASPWETTKYRVIAYEGSCIPDSSHVELIVHPKPTVSIRGGQTIVAGTNADLLASGEHIERFLWSPAQTLSCETCANPIASPYKTTTYTVKVFSKFNCVDSADVTISIICDEKQLFVPNTFTPNGDGVNDIFMVRGTGINTLKAFRVYNRWGQVMFEHTDVTVNDKTYGWDGTFNGAALPPDVYVWTVEAYCENGDLLKLKGDVTIIR